ncbi:glycosyltransferase family 2 protein [Nocardiopsis gilva]|uniref:glycosyltransferase n=1 Tax=Nocardiopsis gilva TaxID=280236 RepID=UPI0012FE0974|nr:glycosyltransferase [Nocardiopsis gilva]
MIHDLLRTALELSGRERALLCHIGGDAARDQLPTGTPPADCRVVDLDGDLPEGPDALRDPPSPIGLAALVAATPTDLRRALVLTEALPPSAHILLGIAAVPESRTPPLPTAPGIDQWADLHDLQARRHADDAWSCEFRFLEAVAVREAVLAVARSIGGGRRQSTASPLVALSGPDASLWRPGDPTAVRVSARGPVPLRGVAPIADTALCTHNGQPPYWTDDRIDRVDRTGIAALSWARFGQAGDGRRIRELRPGALEVDDVPPIDERVVNPMGFRQTTSERVAVLVPRPDRWAVVIGRTELLRVPDSGTITDVDLARLRHLRGVRVEWRQHSGPLAAVRAVAGLAAGGVPVFSGPVPRWGRCLGEELRTLLTSVTADDLADPLTREEHSVRLRRAALRTHGSAARWRRIGARLGFPAPPAPTVSVILCTRRPGMLGFALHQIARQRGVDLEVVLGLHGCDPDLPEVRAAVSAFRATGRELTVHAADSDTRFGVLLNQLAARASGSVIAKMDDDDWYSPDHLADLLLARDYSGADVFGCSDEYVYLVDFHQTIRLATTSERPTSFVSGGTISMDRAVVEDLVAFRPIAASEDSQLLLNVVRSGGRIYATHGLGYVTRRSESSGHLWTEGTACYLRSGSRQWYGWRPSSLLECEQPFLAPWEAGTVPAQKIGGDCDGRRQGIA